MDDTSVLNKDFSKMVRLGSRDCILRPLSCGASRRLHLKLTGIQVKRDKLVEANDAVKATELLHESMDVAIKGVCDKEVIKDWDQILEDADADEICLAFDAAKEVINGPLERMAQRAQDKIELEKVARK